VKERVDGRLLYVTKEPIPTLDIDEHILVPFVVADAPDHSAARDLDALQRVKIDCANAFHIDNLTVSLANSEQQRQDNSAQTHGRLCR
jgi:hypothetical protein